MSLVACVFSVWDYLALFGCTLGCLGCSSRGFLYVLVCC